MKPSHQLIRLLGIAATLLAVMRSTNGRGDTESLDATLSYRGTTAALVRYQIQERPEPEAIASIDVRREKSYLRIHGDLHTASGLDAVEMRSAFFQLGESAWTIRAGLQETYGIALGPITDFWESFRFAGLLQEFLADQHIPLLGPSFQSDFEMESFNWTIAAAQASDGDSVGIFGSGLAVKHGNAGINVAAMVSDRGNSPPWKMLTVSTEMKTPAIEAIYLVAKVGDNYTTLPLAEHSSIFTFLDASITLGLTPVHRLSSSIQHLSPDHHHPAERKLRTLLRYQFLMQNSVSFFAITDIISSNLGTSHVDRFEGTGLSLGVFQSF